MRKLSIIFLIIISFIILNKNVNAYTIDSGPFNQVVYVSSGYNGSFSITNYFVNQGKGNIFFTITTWPSSLGTSYNRPILGVTAVRDTDYKHFECDIGNNFIYDDNITLHTIYSITCPVDFSNNTSLYAIDVKFNQVISNANITMRTSDFITFVQDPSIDIVNALLNNNYNNAISSINSNITNSANDIMSNQNTNTDKVVNAQNGTTNAINGLNNSINNDDTSGSENALTSIINDNAFQDNTGINSIITLPVNMISSLSNTCQPITINIPFINSNVQLPCFRAVITQHMPIVANLIGIVVNGFILYRILIDIVGIVKSARNPDEDRLDVLEL